MKLPAMTKPLSTSEEMIAYRASAQIRQQHKRDRLLAHHQLGLTVAKQAGTVLKQRFKAEKVVLFDSMLSSAQIHTRSDVKLAVRGSILEDYYRAVGHLLALRCQNSN